MGERERVKGKKGEAGEGGIEAGATQNISK